MWTSWTVNINNVKMLKLQVSSIWKQKFSPHVSLLIMEIIFPWNAHVCIYSDRRMKISIFSRLLIVLKKCIGWITNTKLLRVRKRMNSTSIVYIHLGRHKFSCFDSSTCLWIIEQFSVFEVRNGRNLRTQKPKWISLNESRSTYYEERRK